ncbi:hypothetical protein SAMN04488515_0935 [Cognatiyoonia koreensis]|uniref:Uncharacterized protein n=1 Tax=Cognatiyoonia koreensis TaxID=364200 RepID=A0A1I0P0V5_9RHOB|nr:hypothetical protein [Cognatiyoonia koreensis]SEW07591.1 hypothetical protein SAMN04488515_0935 [Cognatiyoonia koreensis]
MPVRRTAILVTLLAGTAAAQDGSPLSAIDWLSQSVTPATAAPEAPQAKPIDEPAVTDNADPPPVRVTPLDGPSPDPVGLLPSNVTGLPRSLWAGSDEALLVTLVQAEAMPTLPAIKDFLVVLMLAEADPPLAASPDGPLFLARVDKLLDQGTLQEAQALLEQAGGDTPDQFRRLFDVALLTGTEDDACTIMDERPAVAPTFPARIFCLARSGDWTRAALTLNTHRVLGDITEEEEALLSRFLDPELYEGEDSLPEPSRISPLVFRMREAIGEGFPTDNLPLAFAHADLRDTAGLKAQLEAAERLIQADAIDPNVLQELYTSRTPSASGGVWDRASSFQAFDRALAAGDATAISQTLPDAWTAMKEIKSEVAFARLYAAELQDLDLSGNAAELAEIIGLLSDDYEAVAMAAENISPFLIALAKGVPQETRANTPDERAVQAAFNGANPPQVIADLLDAGKLGEALLRTIALFEAASAGDTQSMTDALSVLRRVGLEDVARKASLQYLLLERSI